jgi:hypothetical protein
MKKIVASLVALALVSCGTKATKKFREEFFI